MTPHGVVSRTPDGGVTWRAVLCARPGAMLLTHGPKGAKVVVTVGRGHVDHHARTTNLVVYRTGDGGRDWTPEVIALPSR